MLAVHPADLSPSQAIAAQSTHGLGLIADASSAKVTKRINGDHSLQVTAPWTEHNAELLIADRLICYDGQFYRITIPSRRERGSRRTISLEAPHVMYDLEHSYIPSLETKEDPAYLDGITAQQALTQVLAGTPFVPGTVDVEEKMDYLDLVDVHRVDALSQIVEIWGGELVADNWTIHLRAKAGEDQGVQIRVGKNISGIDCTEDIGAVVTRLHVLGYQGANFKDINDGKDYLDSPNIGKYAFVREGYARFEDDEEPEELLRLGQEELSKRDKPRLTIKVDLERLRGSGQYRWYQDLERISLGDTVTVHHDFLGENIKVRALEIEEDCLTGNADTVILDEINTQGLFHGFSTFVRTAELVRKILDHDGHVRARTLRGEIDLLTTRLIASGSYQNAQVIEGKGALLENTNAGSPDYGAVYIGPGILSIADSKNPDGTWAWRTFGTGKGFTGAEILAYSIHGTKIQAHTIGVEQLHPEIVSEVANSVTGQQLVMELSHGAILDADNTTTTASLRVYHQGVEITDRIPEAALRWERVSDDPIGDAAFNDNPAHIGVKSIQVTAQDVDFRGVLRCRMEEVRLYAVPVYEDGHLLMQDFDSQDATRFAMVDGHLVYEGPNGYIAQDGSLYIDMTIGAGQVDTQLQNLNTSYLSLTRKGLELYGSGFLRLKTGGKMTLEAGSDLSIKAGAGFDLVAGSGETYLRLTNQDPDIRMLVGGESKQTAPFYLTPTGEVKATKLQLNNSNITDFTQMYGYNEADNADQNNPVVFRIFVPAECSGVQSLKLSFLLEPFRAYSTGAASGGGQAVTSRSGGGSTSAQNVQATLTGLSNAFNTGTPSTSVFSQHEHPVYAHTHSIAPHTHGISSHEHILDLPSHTHGILYGIYQGPTAAGCSVYIDGTFIGNFTGLVAHDVVGWLTKTSGRVTRDTWHSIALYPYSLTRVVAQAFLIAVINQANNAVY